VREPLTDEIEVVIDWAVADLAEKILRSSADMAKRLMSTIVRVSIEKLPSRGQTGELP